LWPVTANRTTSVPFSSSPCSRRGSAAPNGAKQALRHIERHYLTINGTGPYAGLWREAGVNSHRWHCHLWCVTAMLTEITVIGR
jgi:hypothetical protein